MSMSPLRMDGDHPAKRLRQAKLMVRLFRGREDHVAVARRNGFAPEALKGPLTPNRLAAEHLAGARCLGFYLMMPGDLVVCSCADFDNKPHRPDAEWRSKTERVYRALLQRGLSPVVEISQSGAAAHVWVFF